jgi:hypothetical protein
MKTATIYITDDANNVEIAVLPEGRAEINLYVDRLLTPKEEHACNMATD